MVDVRTRTFRAPARRGLAAIALVSAAGLGVAACGGSSAKSGGSTSPSPTPVVTQNKLPKTVANKPALRKNVAVTSCAATAQGWQATGTATNASSSAATYRITIFFTTPAATVQDYAVKQVVVAPRSTVRWTASKAFAASKTTLCVVRGVG